MICATNISQHLRKYQIILGKLYNGKLSVVDTLQINLSFLFDDI